ncbi:hypothetical protein C8Q74DRAFT_1280305 [Fomes fomentarius]|nr:hypothetical protein C8Q74DRAFT_1280305 [Fomes fomentarius]
MNRSASSPSLLLSPSQASASASVSVPSAHQPQRPSSLGRQSSHTHSQSHSNTHSNSNSNSLRLAVDAISYASESSDAESEPSSVRNGHVLPKQLSPIHEQQVPFPPHRKLSMDSVPRTPDSTRTFDKLNNAFIHRPLKRSLSQTSTSTHRSNISAVPPIIPPLDLRPNFQSVMGVQQNPNSPAVAQGPTGGSIIMTVPIPRKSRLPVPNLPTVIGSPRQMNMVSVIYEDGASASARTSSFITAPSVSLNTPNGEQRRFSFGNVDVMFDPSSFASDSARDSGQTQQTQHTQETERTETDAAHTVETEETDATHRAHPPPAGLSGMYDSDLSGTDGEQDYGQLTQLRPHSGPSVRPRNPTPSSTHSRSHSRPDSLAVRDSHLAVPRSRTPTDESFLEQRWLKGTSFAAERFALPPSVQRQQRRDAREITYACILFWAGFVMPWCWLIGGWLLTRGGDVSEDERGSVLPLWQRHRHRSGYRRARRSNVDETEAMAGQNSGSGGKRRAGSNRHGDPEVSVPLPAEKRMKAKMWYPLLAPSVESLAPSDADSTHRMKRSKRTRPDPWIRRCRVAAMVSGILIFVAFVVAIVLVAGVRM